MTLAVFPALAWFFGLFGGVGLLWFGIHVLRRLVRAQVPWWPALAPALILFGPAVGILLGAFFSGHWHLFGEQAGWEVNLAWSVIVFFGVTALLGLVRAFLQSHVVKEELGVHIPALVLDAARYVVWITMIFVVVGMIWGKTEWFSALFTASAVGTVILGFALQETLSNFFAGIALVAEGVYGIGDWVWVGDTEGQVIAITRRSTRLKTRTGDLVTVSNRSIATSTIRNTSLPAPDHAEFVHVSAPYEAPPNRVRDVLYAAVSGTPGVLANPAPKVRLLRFADSGIDYEVKLWLQDLAGLPDILSAARVRIWYHFRRAGISIPFPIRELHRPGGRGRGAGGAREDVEARLRSVPFFEAMPQEVLALLVGGTRTIEFGAGETVVKRGERGEDCYVVDAGKVAVLVAEGDEEKQVSTLGPGDLFGEMSLLTGETRSATVSTLEDTRLLCVGGRVLGEAVQRSPDLAHRLAELVVLRREGLLEARAALDTAAKARVDAGALRLSQAIRRFFRVQGHR